MKLKDIITYIVVIVSTVVVTAGVVGASYLTTMSTDKATRAQAIDGCYEVATGKEITSPEEGGWVVEKAQLNEELLNTCLAKQGI